MRVLLIIVFGLCSNVLLSQSKAENFGGKQEKIRMYEQELYYAQNSLDQYYGGKVELEFDLNEKGQINNIIVLKSVSRDLNAEAIRLLKLMLWIPATENDHPVSTHETISFKFNPAKYSSLCKKRDYKIEKPGREFIYSVYAPKDLSTEPKFIGKESSFQNYVKDNLSYPEEAVKNEAQGIVEVLFVVEPSGRLTNIHVQKKLEANCDIVARELILNSKWKAGNMNGIPVRTLLKRKIYFSPNGSLPFITVPDQD